MRPGVPPIFLDFNISVCERVMEWTFRAHWVSPISPLKGLRFFIAGMGQHNRHQQPASRPGQSLAHQELLNIYGTTSNRIFMPS